MSIHPVALITYELNFINHDSDEMVIVGGVLSLCNPIMSAPLL